MKALFHKKERPHFPKIDIFRLKFCQDFEAEFRSRVEVEFEDEVW